MMLRYGPSVRQNARVRVVGVAVLAAVLLAALWPGAGLAQTASLTAGTVLTVNAAAGTVTITDARGVTGQYRVAPGAELIVYDRPARLADLLPGLAVWFRARQGDIVLLTAPATAQPAATAPPPTSEPQRVSGRLQYIDGTTVAVIVADGEVQTYRRTNRTEAYRAGTPVSAAALDPGDVVTLTLSGPGQTDVVRIEAQPAPYPAVELYRGRLQSVWPGRQELVLARAERLVHGRWQSAADWLRLPVAQGADIYVYGDPADLTAASQRGIGQVAYAAVAADGSQAALKVSVLPPASALFMAAPAGVSYGRSEIVFPAEYGTVATGESSILIRNGRLVDFYGLSAEGSYTIALGPAPGTGMPDQLAPGFTPAQFAAAAVQETFLPHGLALHWGLLETAGSGQVTIRYPRQFVPYQFELISNHWREAVTISYGLAVRGRDWRAGQDGRSFDRFELDRQAGLVNWDSRRLTGQWVLAASRNGELIALDVLPGLPGGGQYPDLMEAIVTAGTVDVGDGELTLTAPVTWNALAGRWEADKLDWPLHVPATALWLGPDGPVDPGSVAPGTPVTVLRSDFSVHIVLIR